MINILLNDAFITGIHTESEAIEYARDALSNNPYEAPIKISALHSMTGDKQHLATVYFDFEHCQVTHARHLFPRFRHWLCPPNPQSPIFSVF